MTPEELEGIYGPLYRYSEHKVGINITFSDPLTDKQRSADIIWIQGPGQRVQGGYNHPATYVLDIIDPDTGMPFTVAPSDVLAWRV